MDTKESSRESKGCEVEAILAARKREFEDNLARWKKKREAITAYKKEHPDDHKGWQDREIANSAAYNQCRAEILSRYAQRLAEAKGAKRAGGRS